MLVAATDTKVLATPSSNSFAFGLAAGVRRIRLKRVGKSTVPSAVEPAVTLSNKISRLLEIDADGVGL